MLIENEFTVSIPGLDMGEMAVVESILRGSGITSVFLQGSRGHECELLIARSDLPKAKKLLKDFMTEGLNGTKAPIPW